MKIIITLSLLSLVGCKCFQSEEPSYQGPPEFKPLPPEKLRDLRFICDGYAYKSITKKDYNCEENCG